MASVDATAHPSEEAQVSEPQEAPDPQEGLELDTDAGGEEMLRRIAEQMEAEEKEAGGGEEEPAEEAPAEPEEPAKEEPAPEDDDEDKTPAVAKDDEEPNSIAVAWSRAKKAQRENRELQKTIKDMESRFEQMEARFRQSEEELSNDPLKFLEKRGYNYEHLTDRVLNDGKPGDAEQMSRKERMQAEKENQLEQRVNQLVEYIQQKEQQEAISNYRNEIGGLLETDDFRVLAAYDDAVDEVMDYATRYVAEHGRAPTAKEAALDVQNSFRTKLKRLGNYDAVLAELGISRSASESGVSKPSETKKTSAQSKREGASTLSNDEAVTASSGDLDGLDGMTDEELLLFYAKQIPDGAPIVGS